MPTFKDLVTDLMRSLADEGKDDLELTIELDIEDLRKIVEEDEGKLVGFQPTSFRFKTPYGWAHIKAKGVRSFGEGYDR